MKNPNLLKKLLRYAAALSLIAIIIYGCKKDAFIKNTPIAGTGQMQNLISAASIQNWFSTHQIGNYMIPDWAGAQQKLVGGVAVVKVPIQGFYNAGQTAASQAKTQTLKLFTTDTLHFFNPKHPPALFFFAKPNAPVTDSVKALLMDFFPNDPSKENGDNNVWTGTLIEWNMSDQNVYLQYLDKSYAKQKGLLTIGQIISGESRKSITINTTVKSQTLLGDIWNFIVTVVEKIGYFFGVPGEYDLNDGFIRTNTWCDFLWGLFCGSGGGGDGSSGGGTYYISGGPDYNAIYSAYANGYNGNTSGGWDPFAYGSGNVYNPCPSNINVEAVGKKVNEISGCPVYFNPYMQIDVPNADPYNVSQMDDSTSDEDDNDYSNTNFDNTVFDTYQQNQSWPNIPNVILKKDFVGWVTGGNCLTFAKQQLGKAGFTCYGYDPSGQTMQVYTEANGVDVNKTSQAIGYIRSALSRGIPVAIGVDNRVGAPPKNLDRSTDHFVVIVGMGVDSQGNKFFRFFDNSTNQPSAGTSDSNKLYYNPITGLISGTSQSGYAQPGQNGH